MDGGSPTVSTPAVDPAQQALEQQQAAALQEQTQILQSQYQQQQIIAPFLYQAMGLNPQYNAQGQLTGLTQNPQVAANQTLQNQVTGQLLSQEQSALSGTLPVNPVVTNTLQQQQAQLSTMLANNLGPGAAASTPGQMAQNQFNVNQAGIIQGANTGQLTLDQQLALAGQQNYGQTLGQTMAGVTGINSLGFNTAGAYGSLAQGYGQAQIPYMQQAQNTLQANMMTAQLMGQSQAGMGSLFGSGMGMAGMLGAAAIMAA